MDIFFHSKGQFIEKKTGFKIIHEFKVSVIEVKSGDQVFTICDRKSENTFILVIFLELVEIYYGSYSQHCVSLLGLHFKTICCFIVLKFASLNVTKKKKTTVLQHEATQL